MMCLRATPATASAISPSIANTTTAVIEAAPLSFAAAVGESVASGIIKGGLNSRPKMPSASTGMGVVPSPEGLPLARDPSRVGALLWDVPLEPVVYPAPWVRRR